MNSCILSTLLACVLFPCLGRSADVPIHPPLKTESSEWPKSLPVYDHVVIVFEENKNYEQIIGNDWAPYINSVLRKQGACLTKIYGEEHNSEGNYFWMLSGANHGIGFSDEIPKHSIAAPNLAEQLIKKSFSFKGYSEDLPGAGSDVAVFPAPPEKALYARKHAPWVSFGNVPASSNLPFSDFPVDPAKFSELPTVAIVIPNLLNDMHDGKPEESIPRADRWLKEHLDAYFQWAKSHNSLLIVTFDENYNTTQYSGLTNPAVVPGDGPDPEFRANLQNRIPTILAGAHIKPGEYPESKGVTHVNLLRSLEAMYGLQRSGMQQPNALGVGIPDNYIITDIFK